MFIHDRKIIYWCQNGNAQYWGVFKLSLTHFLHNVVTRFSNEDLQRLSCFCCKRERLHQMWSSRLCHYHVTTLVCCQGAGVEIYPGSVCRLVGNGIHHCKDGVLIKVTSASSYQRIT